MSLEISSSPTQLSTNNKRLSKVPLIIVGILAMLVLFAVTYVAISRKQAISQNNQAVEEEKQQTQQVGSNQKNLKSYIESLEDASKSEPIVTYDTKKEEKLPPITPSAPFNSTTVPNLKQPPMTVPPVRDTLSQADEKEMQLKRDLRLKALTSSSMIGNTKAPQTQQAQAASKPTATTKSDDPLASLIAAVAPSEKMSDREATEFLKRTANKGYLQQQKQKQISPYELKAGWIIPATLITGINSDLPGSTLAQVSQNVYDSATGRYLLIPQGSKLVGEYKSGMVYGQERVLTAWTRLIFPNGDTLNLDGMNGTSQDGYSGFTDQVNNHYVRIFGSAFLMSSITAGIAMSDKSSTSGEKETNADKAMAQAVDQMSTVASEMIRKNMNISPTLEIRPGYKFNIFVTKDIILEPLSMEKGI